MFYIPVEPVPASRPRVTRAGFAYYAKPYQDYKQWLHEWWTRAWTLEPITGPVEVNARFVASRPKKTKLHAPRPDVDNYVKALLDAMNGIVWRDDTQVIQITASKAWSDPDHAGIYVTITQP